MKRNAMKIGKAFCRQLDRTIDIEEAGIQYFAQTPPREKYSFYCSSPECELLSPKIEILGVNYHRVPIDTEGREAPTLTEEGSDEDKPILSPYFRTKSGCGHSIDCQWTIDQEAELEYISEAESPHDKKRRRHRVAAEGLAECKNGHVIRKQFGHGHIPQHYATQMNEFNRRYLNPHINYHRPCFYPETITDAKGKQRKTYPYKNMMTPYEKLKSLPNSEQCLKPTLTFAILDKVAYEITDNQSAERLQKARKQLFKTINEQGWASIR